MPLVGRVDDVARLRGALDVAVSGHGQAVLVAGEAGIGKTRLVAELTQASQAAGAQVLSGRCIDLIGAAVPFYALLEALRSARRDGSPVEPRDVIRLAEPDEPTVAEGQLRLFERVWQQLGEMASVAPVVLVLEDLHWADGSTLDFILFVCRVVRQQPVLLVATYRSEDLRPGGVLARAVIELVRSRDAEVLDLGPLPTGEMTELLEQVAARPLPSDLVESIVARSGGNPFFAEELLASALRGDASTPTVLRVALHQRIDRVPPDGHQVLQVAAVLGRDLPHRLLAAVTDLPPTDLDVALRHAVDEGVLVVDRARTAYRFRHALLAEAVYDAMLPGELRRLHDRLAQALRDDPDPGGDTGGHGELARHWDAAGRPAEAFAASIVATRDAEAVFGLGEAFEHLERALRLWPEVPDAGRVAGTDLVSLLTRAAELADLTGRGPRAAELVRAAIEHVDEAAEPPRSGALYSRLGGYLLPTADHAAGLESCHRAVALIPAEPPTEERARALTALANGLLLAWRHAESEQVAREAIRTAEALGDPRPALRAYGIVGIDSCYLGRREEALRQVRLARERALVHGTARDIAHSHAMACEVLLASGRVDEAVRVAIEGREQAERLGVGRSYGALLSAYAAEAWLETGDWDGAEALLADAHRTDTAFWSHYPHLLHAQLATARGRFAAARYHLDAGALGARQPTSAARHTRVVAELSIWQGRPAEGSKAVDEALAAGGRGALPSLVLATLGLCAEADQIHIGQTDGRADPSAAAGRFLRIARRVAARAAALTPDANAWLARAEAEHSRLEGRADPEPWREAVVAWEKLGRPYHTAYCGWRLAEALLTQGPASRVESRQVLRAAYRAATDLGAAPLRHMLELAAQRARLDLDEPLPTEGPDPARALGLTSREVEVLRLLTRGYTNRDIAGELTISVKTASVHVSHILAKLGVSRRIEAAAIGQRLAGTLRGP